MRVPRGLRWTVAAKPVARLVLVCLALRPGTVFGAAAAEPALADELMSEFETASVQRVRDPLRGYNRVMFQVNDRLYFWLLKPVARGYKFVVPEPARACVARFFTNLEFPRNLVNNLLQGEFRDAGVELTRFGVNSTIGLGGLFDPASSYYHLSSREEDFGRTLGRYGVGDAVPITLPLLGPSNLRDTVGKVPDYFLGVFHYLIEDEWVRGGIWAGEKTNHTSLHLGDYESLKKGSVDPYTVVMDSYQQYRRAKLKE